MVVALDWNRGHNKQRLTASGQVKATAGTVVRVLVRAATTAAVLTIYDWPSADANHIAAKVALQSFNLAGSSGVTRSVELDLRCESGIYLGFQNISEATAIFR